MEEKKRKKNCKVKLLSRSLKLISGKEGGFREKETGWRKGESGDKRKKVENIAANLKTI